jgi:predicted GTPase
LVVGQINAGKSSLVNALKQDSVAGVDVLPATDGFHRYRFALSEQVDIYLTDTPGLDGSEKTTVELLKHAVKADLILWLSQANQPAKALDIALLKEWDDYFSNNLGRKKPPVLLITTHNDVLKPQHEWDPPYDLSDTENTKVKTIVAAAAYTREALGFSNTATVIPVALKPGTDPYNIDSLREVLTALCSEARAAQLNRERLEAAETAPVIRRALSQGAGLAESALKLVLR